MPDVKCISHNSRKSPVAASEPRIQRQKIANNSHQLAITNISIEINPEIYKVQPLVPNGEINRGSKTEKSADEKIAYLQESENGLERKVADIGDRKQEFVKCDEECKNSLSVSITYESNQTGSDYEEHCEQVNEVKADIEAHPNDYNEQQIKSLFLLSLRTREIGERFKKNTEALYVLNPKLFSGLKPLIEKTSKLIDKMQVISEEIAELSERIREILNKDKALIEEAKKSIYNLDEKSGDLLKELVEESVDRKNAENKEFIQKTVDKKNYDDKIDRYFEKISQKKRKEKTLIIR